MKFTRQLKGRNYYAYGQGNKGKKMELLNFKTQTLVEGNQLAGAGVLKLRREIPCQERGWFHCFHVDMKLTQHYLCFFPTALPTFIVLPGVWFSFAFDYKMFLF